MNEKRNFVSVCQICFLSHYVKAFCTPPPLWRNEQFGIRQFEFPEIDLNSFQAVEVPDNIRLGHQIEYVFKQLIEHSAEYEILVHNLPVKKGNRTIGEIDFILKEDNTSEIIHVELTYKFYIINPEISEPIHQLMGPNKRDIFFTKMEKITHEQIPLLHSTAGRAELTARYIVLDDIKHEVCFKAQLFLPYAAPEVNIRPLNKACIVGYWFTFETFKSNEFKDCQYYIPHKSQWVIAPHVNVPWSSHFEILLDINIHMLKKNSLMVWMKKSEKDFEKFFVVWW